MKVELRYPIDHKVSGYPYLGLLREANSYGEFIVYFTSKNEGVLVKSNDPTQPIGRVSESWSEDLFDRFEGVLVLEND